VKSASSSQEVELKSEQGSREAESEAKKEKEA